MISTVASQQEGAGFDSSVGPFCVDYEYKHPKSIHRVNWWLTVGVKVSISVQGVAFLLLYDSSTLNRNPK